MAKSKTFEVQEAAATKLLKELGKKVKNASPAKLAKILGALPEEAEDMDEDLLEAMSKGSKKLLSSLAKAVENEQKVTVAQGDEDDDDEEEEKPAKGKKAKKASGKASENGEFSRKTQQGHAINNVLAKASGPLTLEEIVKKASKTIDMSEGRATAHLDYLVEKERAKKTKKGYITA